MTRLGGAGGGGGRKCEAGRPSPLRVGAPVAPWRSSHVVNPSSGVCLSSIHFSIIPSSHRRGKRPTTASLVVQKPLRLLPLLSSERRRGRGGGSVRRQDTRIDYLKGVRSRSLSLSLHPASSSLPPSSSSSLVRGDDPSISPLPLSVRPLNMEGRPERGMGGPTDG